MRIALAWIPALCVKAQNPVVLCQYDGSTGLDKWQWHTGNGVVERHVDLDCLGDEVFNGLELVKLVLGQNIISASGHHSGHLEFIVLDDRRFPMSGNI